MTVCLNPIVTGARTSGSYHDNTEYTVRCTEGVIHVGMILPQLPPSNKSVRFGVGHGHECRYHRIISRCVVVVEHLFCPYASAVFCESMVCVLTL